MARQASTKLVELIEATEAIVGDGGSRVDDQAKLMDLDAAAQRAEEVKQPTEAGARHDPRAAGEDHEAWIVEGLEVKDTLDAQGRAEEQRQREAPLPKIGAAATRSMLRKASMSSRGGTSTRLLDARRPRPLHVG